MLRSQRLIGIGLDAFVVNVTDVTARPHAADFAIRSFPTMTLRAFPACPGCSVAYFRAKPLEAVLSRQGIVFKRPLSS